MKSRKSRMSWEDAQDIIGTRTGRLLVISYYHYGHNPNGRGAKDMTHYYTCKCDCGKELITRRCNLKKQDIKSCGCLVIELQKRKATEGAKGEEGKRRLLRSLYSNHKHQAGYRGFKFNLSREFHKELVLAECHYCGIVGNNSKKGAYGYGELKYNGIDRVDNSRDYDEDNCVTCCIVCNRAKMEMSYSEYQEYIQRLISFHSKDNGSI